MKHLHLWVLYIILSIAMCVVAYGIQMKMEASPCDSFHYKQSVVIHSGFYAGVHGIVVGEGFRRSSFTVQLDSLLLPKEVECSDMIK